MIRTLRIKKRLLSLAAVGLGLAVLPTPAHAQEIYLTGPLAGAPPVRKLRLYRQNRFEVAPAVTFTLLDEYQRHILLGGRLQYNFTDWLAVGAWGAYGGALRLTTGLTENIQAVNESRQSTLNACEATPDLDGCESAELSRRLTEVNLGPDFKKQLGAIDWVVAPQITIVPLRGKLALFQSIYLDTDFFLSAGPAFIGLTERKDCDACAGVFDTATRTAIAPTAAFGFSFYINKWSALGWEYRFMPFAWNRGGFDVAGGGKDNEFPDQKITSADQQFNVNMLMSVSFNVYLPTQYKVSE